MRQIAVGIALTPMILVPFLVVDALHDPGVLLREWETYLVLFAAPIFIGVIIWIRSSRGGDTQRS